MESDLRETTENTPSSNPNEILEKTVRNNNMTPESNDDFNVTPNSHPQINGDRTQNTRANTATENTPSNNPNEIHEETVPNNNVSLESNDDSNITLDNQPQNKGNKTQNTETIAVTLLNNMRSVVQSFEQYINNIVDSSQNSGNELLNNITLDEFSSSSETLAELEILTRLQLAEKGYANELNLSNEELGGIEILNLDEYESEQLMNDMYNQVDISDMDDEDMNDENIIDDEDIIDLVDNDNASDQKQDRPKNNMATTQEPLSKPYSFELVLVEEDVICISSDSDSDENCVANDKAVNLKVTQKKIVDKGNTINNDADVIVAGKQAHCTDIDNLKTTESFKTDTINETQVSDTENNSFKSTDVNDNASKNLNQTKINDIKTDDGKDGNASQLLLVNKDLANASEITTNMIDENSCSSYHSSDFEFITEEEANRNIFINNNTVPIDVNSIRRLKTIEISRDSGFNDSNCSQNSPGPSWRNFNVSDYRSARERYEAANFDINAYTDRQYRRNHIVPDANGYLDLFQGVFSPVTPFMLENKSTMPLRYVQYEGVGFDLWAVNGGPDESDNEYEEEAEETARKILNMYPEENRRKRRRQ
ncbi:hypothetical protein evm_008807 [Chilo suppressalis]|nr:hypothetical protein evm_008807 [Chilo suppressalis]